MNILKLKDLKEGNVYELHNNKTNYTTYVRILNIVDEETIFANYIKVAYGIRGEIEFAEFSKGGYIDNKIGLTFTEISSEEFSNIILQSINSLATI